MWEQRLEVYVRSSFTVVNLHDLWSNYPRSILGVIGLCMKSWEATCGNSKFWGHGPMIAVETPLVMVSAVTTTHGTAEICILLRAF